MFKQGKPFATGPPSQPQDWESGEEMKRHRAFIGKGARIQGHKMRSTAGYQSAKTSSSCREICCFQDPEVTGLASLEIGDKKVVILLSDKAEVWGGWQNGSGQD